MDFDPTGYTIDTIAASNPLKPVACCTDMMKEWLGGRGGGGGRREAGQERGEGWAMEMHSLIRHSYRTLHGTPNTTYHTSHYNITYHLCIYVHHVHTGLNTHYPPHITIPTTPYTTTLHLCIYVYTAWSSGPSYKFLSFLYFHFVNL